MNENITLEKPASQRQTFAVYCVLKFDVRDCNLSYDEASELIQLANSNREAALVKVAAIPGAIKKGDVKCNPGGHQANSGKASHKEIFREAHAAGMKAGNECVPVPMVVCQHADVLNDASKVVKAWHVPSGVCGFASVVIEEGRSSFAKWMREHQESGKHYYGGEEFFVHEFGQSLEMKEAYCHAFCGVLAKHGIKARTWSRMD